MFETRVSNHFGVGLISLTLSIDHLRIARPSRAQTNLEFTLVRDLQHRLLIPDSQSCSSNGLEPRLETRSDKQCK